MLTELDEQLAALEAERNLTQRNIAEVTRKMELVDTGSAAPYLAQVSLLSGERAILAKLLTSQDLKLDALREQSARAAERTALQIDCEKCERVLAGQVADVLATLEKLTAIRSRLHAAGGIWQAALRRNALHEALRDALNYWATTRPEVLGLPPKFSPETRSRRELEVKIESAEAAIKREEQRRLGPLEDSNIRDAKLGQARESLAADRQALANFDRMVP